MKLSKPNFNDLNSLQLNDLISLLKLATTGSSEEREKARKKFSFIDEAYRKNITYFFKSGKRLYHYNEEDAEDMTQEVIVKMYKKMYRFNIADPSKAIELENDLNKWVRKIALNHLMDFLRKRGRQGKFQDTIALTDMDKTTYVSLIESIMDTPVRGFSEKQLIELEENVIWAIDNILPKKQSIILRATMFVKPEVFRKKTYKLNLLMEESNTHNEDTLWRYRNRAKDKVREFLIKKMEAMRDSDIL
jgi:DNA-directed RNA polymerase specialized sigma24 family protein